MDEFNFGKPARPQVSLNPKVLMAVGALVAAALAVFGFMSMVSKGGHEVAAAQVTAVQQIDHSQDVVAQTSLRNAMAAAKSLYLDKLTYEGSGPADLAGVEPSFTYTDGPSPDPQTISVAMQGSVAGLAAMSPSGTCFYLKDDEAAGTTYGSGIECTGTAALSAAAPSW
jgi:type IV pilus assembly protein PilA